MWTNNCRKCGVVRRKVETGYRLTLSFRFHEGRHDGGPLNLVRSGLETYSRERRRGGVWCDFCLSTTNEKKETKEFGRNRVEGLDVTIGCFRNNVLFI